MDKCSPIEMRKNLEVVDLLKRNGIDFVPIPARDEKHKKELVELMKKSFDEIIFNCEQEKMEYNIYKPFENTEVEYIILPGEPKTFDHPGCEPEIEFGDIRINGKHAGYDIEDYLYEQLKDRKMEDEL